MFAVLFLYLKEPELIVANLVSNSVTARIFDTETLEGHLQKGGGDKVLCIRSAHVYLFTVTADGP